MSNHSEQIMKALSGFVPEEARKDVSDALNAFVAETTAKIQEAADAKVEEAKAELAATLDEAEKTGYTGYLQAVDIIDELRDRLETQKVELKAQLEEGFEQAYAKIKLVQEEAAATEAKMYDEYEAKLQGVKEFMVDKLDAFLAQQGDKYYEAARKEVENDPAIAGKKVAVDKILEVAAEYLSDEDYSHATSSKLESTQKQLDEAKAQVRLLEGKATRQRIEIASLTEAVRKNEAVLSEAAKVATNEKIEKAKKVEGRGVTAPKGSKRVEVLLDESTAVKETVAAPAKADADDAFFEGFDPADIEHWNKAAFFKPGDIG